jgi:hypothetical protein
MRELTATPTPVGSTTATTTTTAERRSVWRHGLAATLGAAIATTGAAALARAAGVSFGDAPDTIPLWSFAQLTIVFSLLGVAIAAVLARKARRPRSTFVRTTVVLVILSFVPDAIAGFDLASALSLMLIHVVAASIVIPALASRLAPTR